MTFLKDENGQGMVEYGLILGLIAVVAIALIVVVGKRVKGSFQSANENMSDVPAAD
ncbi:MAG: Flp family type IVb pilin [Ruminococcaceae bacterium]|jgi:pilus assembly protein Flp/PilA|nr:Flp family type IVb pilin [Oscillospiraceae bacterium]